MVKYYNRVKGWDDESRVGYGIPGNIKMHKKAQKPVSRRETKCRGLAPLSSWQVKTVSGVPKIRDS
jgi:hypothetical protein